MAAIGNLEVDMMADVAKLVSAFETGAKKTEEFQQSIEKMAEGAKRAFEVIEATMVFEKLAEGVKEIVDATSKGEQAFNQIKASIASTGGAAGVTAGQMEELATKMSRMTGIPKSVIESGEAVLLTFNRIGKETIPEAMDVLVNMSAKMGGDVTDSARKLGKALEDPEKAAGLLKRAGVVLTAQQKDMIKSFQEAGEMAKAQGVLLGALKTSTDGAAAANRDTLGGAFKQVKTDLESLWEAMGQSKGFEIFRVGVEMVAVELEKFTDWIIKGQANTNAFFTAIGPYAEGAAHVLTTFAGLVIGAFNNIMESVKGLWNGAVQLTQITWNTIAGIIDLATMSMPGSAQKAMDRMGKQSAELVAKYQQDFGKLGAVMDKSAQNMFHSSTDKFFKPFKEEWNSARKEAEGNIKQLDDQLSKLRANTNTGDGADGDGGKAAKAALAAAEKQEAAEQKILDIANKKLNELQNELAGVKELSGLEEGIAAIMKGANTNDAADMARRLTEVNKLQKTWEEIGKTKDAINAKKIDDAEVKNLDELLAREKERLKDAQNLASGQKQISESEKAEAEIIKAMKGDISAHKDIQNQILETVKKRIEIEKQEKDDKAIAEADKLLTSLKDQVTEADLKLTGQKNLIEPLKQEEKLREDIAKLVQQGLDPAAAQQALAMGQQEIDLLAQKNQQLSQQDNTYQLIMSDTSNLTATQNKLNAAIASGTINQDQYDKGCIKLGEDMQKVAEKDAKDFVNVLEKGFDAAIKGGQSLDKIFQQLGKDLLMLLAKQLLFKPLEQWLGGGMQGGLGGLAGGILKPIGNLLGGHYAAGGSPMLNRFNLVGEQGPELFMPQQAGMILPAGITQLLMALMGGGSGGMMMGAGMGGGSGAINPSMFPTNFQPNQSGSSPITASSWAAMNGGLVNGTVSNNTQLQISQDQFLARMNQDQMVYNQNPSAYMATRLAEDTNQYKFWQAQTPGSVSQMRWDTQGEFGAMQQLGLGNFGNISPQVLQYLYGQNNKNYGLASGGGAMDVVGGDDGGGGWGLGPSASSGMLGGGLTPGAMSSPLFGGDPGSSSPGGSGSTNVPGSSWSSSGTADNAWQNGIPIGTNTQEFDWLGNGIANPNGTAGDTSWQNGFQTGFGTQDFQWDNPAFQLGGNSPVSGASGSGANWSTGAGTQVYDYSGNNDTYTAGNTSQAQNFAQWSDSFGAPPNTQDYATQGPMGYGGWTPGPEDPNFSGNSFWNDGAQFFNGPDTPIGNLLGMLNASGGFLGGGSLDQLMQMFTGDPSVLNSFAGSALGPGGAFGANGPDAFNMGLSNMFGDNGGGSGGPFRGYADGGRPLPNFPAMVGENGPEIWEPDAPGKIIPNNQTGGWRGSPQHARNDDDDSTKEYSNSGGPEVHIHNHSSQHIEHGGISFQKDHRGRDQLHVVLNDLVAAQVNKGRTRNALVNGFQLNPRGVPRS